MQITGTQIAYHFLCKRKLWLFSNGIQMEHNSDSVYEGKLISDSTYTRRSEKGGELEIAGVKIDHYDAKNKIVHEVKKSNKAECAHEWQVKFYLLVLERFGIESVKGMLEYPKLRLKKEVNLTDKDREYFKEVEKDLPNVINSKICPPLLNKAICKNCSYHDFCYSNEDL